jgi:hypothetical protein
MNSYGVDSDAVMKPDFSETLNSLSLLRYSFFSQRLTLHHRCFKKKKIIV